MSDDWRKRDDEYWRDYAKRLEVHLMSAEIDFERIAEAAGYKPLGWGAFEGEPDREKIVKQIIDFLESYMFEH